MRFYDMIQFDPAAVNRQIAQTDDPKEIRRWRWASIVRALLIVIFSVVFISLMSALFGAENSSMAVSIFCILLAVRFVGYGYNIKDALINMFLVFAILLFVPLAAWECGLIGKLIFYCAGLLVMLLMVCQKPQLGNGGLYTFSFIFLSENPVSGQALISRAGMALVGFLLCAIVMYRNHKNQDRDIRFLEILKKKSLKDPLFQWILRLALLSLIHI